MTVPWLGLVEQLSQGRKLPTKSKFKSLQAPQNMRWLRSTIVYFPALSSSKHCGNLHLRLHTWRSSCARSMLAIPFAIVNLL